MQLQNFECQIAKAQIGRYVAGDSLSEETVAQLEAHIGKCPDCKQNLAERRAVLQAVLSPSEPEPEAQEKSQTPKQKKPRFDLGDMIRSKIQAKLPAPKTAPGATPSNFTKPALYSLALGVVLIGMSYFSRNMDSMLGPKAAKKSIAAENETKPTIAAAIPPEIKKDQAEPENKPATAPKTEEKEPEVKQEVKKPKLPPPAVEISSTPPPARKEPTRKRDRSRSKRKHSDNVIRVYEPEN